jgi:hypothetical protein
MDSNSILYGGHLESDRDWPKFGLIALIRLAGVLLLGLPVIT